MGDEFDSNSKEKLVREICSISSLFSSCSHSRSSTRKRGFVDWYLILGVDEDSGIDVIRRRYRQLALQLHPDKNRHPKAEVAFKLISEAYECLSDKGRRKVFNSDRKNTYCKECHRKSQQQHSAAQKNHKDAAPQAKQHKLLRAFKEVQNRLREECRVIENCLRANEAAGRMESPLFDPSDRLHFPEYPHYRDRVYFSNFSCSSEYRKVRSESQVRCESPVYQIRTESRLRCESPVYQIRTESRRSWSKNPGFRF